MKNKQIYQLNMFGDDEKVRKPRKKMSDQEKQERKEQRELEKKIKQEKEFEDKMAKLGHPQLYMDFDESVNNVVKEEIDKFIDESTIKIKPENKGKFTEYCGGNVTQECIAKGKNSPDPKIRKRVTFAANARR